MSGRLMFLAGLLVMVFAMFVPGTVLAEDGANQANPIQIKNPAVDLWREVRQRDDLTTAGTTQDRGVDAGILINPYGEEWRQFRMLELIPVGGYALLIVLALIVIFFVLRGQIKIASGTSGKKLLRYTLSERSIHWFLAITFIVLGITGLVLLFGRAVLIPVMGNEAFSPLADFSKVSHDLVGPLFALALILMFVKFVSRNIYAKGDLMWLLKGGGIIGKTHPRAGYFNMGEKSMFWLVMIGGLAVCISGFVLLFANFGQGREVMELSHLVHAVAVLVLIAMIFGHIYIGTIGMQGSFEGMSTGFCDLNWAKEHHSDWANAAEGEALSDEEVKKIRGA